MTTRRNFLAAVLFGVGAAVVTRGKVTAGVEATPFNTPFSDKLFGDALERLKESQQQHADAIAGLNKKIEGMKPEDVIASGGDSGAAVFFRAAGMV